MADPGNASTQNGVSREECCRIAIPGATPSYRS